MSSEEGIRPEVAQIFHRLEAVGASQRELADVLGLDDAKVSKIKNGVRQLRGTEILRALNWLTRLEQGGMWRLPTFHRSTLA